ncbi:MAG: LPS export ABC transporter permease LptG [Deltaproteobacteria bacterium]|nr:LPS export ABC transporter permease LptG [Deltaproteobacteria bacterium]
MKTLDRYISLSFLKNLSLALLFLMAIFFVQSILGELLEREFPSLQVLFYNTLKLPQIMAQMLPPAILMTTVITLASFNRTSELIAFYSLGIGLMRICMVILTLVIMICCLGLILQDRVLPYFYKKRTTYYWRDMKKKTDFFFDVKQDKIWYRSQNFIYNLKSYDSKTNTIYGMSVYTFDRQFRLVEVIDTQKAFYSQKGWRFINGTITIFQKDNPFPLTQFFSEKDLLISQTPKDFQEIEKEVDGLRLKDFYRYIKKVKNTGADTKTYEVRFQSRISLCFISFVMCILGIPFSISRTRGGGVARDFGLCLIFTFFYWLFYSVGLSLGTNGTLLPWVGAWLPSAIFLALALVLLVRKKLFLS